MYKQHSDRSWKWTEFPKSDAWYWLKIRRKSEWPLEADSKDKQSALLSFFAREISDYDKICKQVLTDVQGRDHLSISHNVLDNNKRKNVLVSVWLQESGYINQARKQGNGNL